MAPSLDETFTAYLEQVRAHRAELRESVAAVDEALTDAVDRGDWPQRLHTALLELSHDFTDHVELTERPGGLYDTVRRKAHRLAGAVDKLVDDHLGLREEISRAIAVLEATPPQEPSAVKGEMTDLVERLVRHRQKGGQLVYEAFAVDLGGSG